MMGIPPGFGGMGGTFIGGGLWSSLVLYGIIYLIISGIIYLLGFRGLNYLKLFKIIMGGIKTFIGEGPIRGRVI